MSLIKITETSALNTKISKHLIAKMFMCPCCKTVLVNSILLDKLEAFIDLTKTDIKITSAYRCLNHNKALKSGNKSEHTTGNAVDLNLGYTKNAIDVFKQASKIFNRVGIYQSENDPKHAFIHVDIKPNDKCYWVCHRIKGIQKYTYFESVDSLLIYLNTDKNIDWQHLVI